MIQALDAVYDGTVLRPDRPLQLMPNTRVHIVIESGHEIDLMAHGVGPAEAAALRARLAAFEDWNDPEMDAYGDYDAAAAKL